VIALAAVVGVAIGITLGALGGGGSILTVPALVYLLGQNAHGATTASLVVVGATALAGSVAHWRCGRVRVAEGLVFGALGIAGAILGSWLSSGISSAELLAGFSIVMLAAAAAMMLRSLRPAEATTKTSLQGPVGSTGGSDPVASTPTLAAVRSRVNPAVLVVTASAVGLLTGFFGVGGGFVVVPALVLVMGFDMTAAVGTSLLVIVINSSAALVTRLGTPVHVDWTLIGVFTVTAIGASVFGSRLLSVAGPRPMTRAFSVLLAVVAVYTLVRNIPHL
jgi:uncharacterized protein